MQVNYLKKDMLVYELTVRGIPANETNTVDELRTTLRPVLQLEKAGKPLNYPAYSRDLKEEF